MPRGPTANWRCLQYKKAAMQAYAIAASAGSRGNVRNPGPAGLGESDQRACAGNCILRFPDFHFQKFSVGRAVEATVPSDFERRFGRLKNSGEGRQRATDRTSAFCGLVHFLTSATAPVYGHASPTVCGWSTAHCCARFAPVAQSSERRASNAEVCR